ncbi:unnamed protein product [Arctia plantaginis]|uniref:LITAF domain-containing protein n=1 Tax=Arctia plantaginis TaxID=874455 RepID=A0A8S1B643_ARCPL|nr:unnamed protein product [Arctia plantaginis]
MEKMELRDSKMAGATPDKPPPYSESFQNPGGPNMTLPTAPPIRPVVHTVVMQQMGPRSTTIVCKSCNHQIQTRVEFQPTTKTHLFALVLCLIGCWPFACLPYCMDSCNSADHYCPSCNAYIGSYVN